VGSAVSFSISIGIVTITFAPPKGLLWPDSASLDTVFLKAEKKDGFTEMNNTA
jgi:hypothetical protein